MTTTLLIALCLILAILNILQRLQYVRLRRRYGVVYEIALESRANVKRLKKFNKCGRGK